jgi:hypothetical protein
LIFDLNNAIIFSVSETIPGYFAACFLYIRPSRTLEAEMDNSLVTVLAGGMTLVMVVLLVNILSVRKEPLVLMSGVLAAIAGIGALFLPCFRPIAILGLAVFLIFVVSLLLQRMFRRI